MRIAVLICVLSVLAGAYSQSHDLVLGHIRPGDVLLYEGHKAKHGIPFIKRTSDIEFPSNDPRNVVISAIFVRDNVQDGTGGFPSITKGGIDENYVNINLESQRGKGFNFSIKIYGSYVLLDSN